jgi:hypothetical protein
MLTKWAIDSSWVTLRKCLSDFILSKEIRIKFIIPSILFLNLLFSGCAQTSKSHQPVPVWVASPYDFCKSQEEVCGVGSGSNLKQADLSSKNEVGSFFRLQLSSNLVSSISSMVSENEKTGSSVIVNSQQQESFQQVISSQVDEIVEGVEVVQRYILNDKEYYSLARLKKSLLEDLLRQKISVIDQKRQELLEEKARLSLFPLKKLLVERQGIEKLLSMLDRPLIGHKKSQSWWEETNSMMQSPKTIKLSLDQNSDPEWESLLQAVLTESGHKLTSSQSARYIIKSSFSMKMEPINVEGFLKARVQWRASCFDQEKGSEVTGSIDESLDVSARNKEQLWHKAKDHFKSKILEKIYLLKI